MEADGLIFHIGVETFEERRWLWWMMTRRSIQAEIRYGWRGPLGRSTASAAGIGALLGTVDWSLSGSMVSLWATPMLMGAAMIFVGAPTSVIATAFVRWWRLSSRRTRWVAHWCEGGGRFAVRMTRPRQGDENHPATWPGRDFLATGGAGRHLLAWLQQLADAHRATLIITTASAPLIGYYQRAGFTLVRRRFGVAKLLYPQPAQNPRGSSTGAPRT